MFSDLLNETDNFKYQITVEILLKKYKHNGEIEFRPIYFNSVTKAVTNHIFKLENSFEEILYMIDVWINHGSGWIIELTESQYINISTYSALSGSSYMDLPVELRSPTKGLINIKNKDKNCFYGVMLDMTKDINKIEVKNNICINVFAYENRLVFPIYISDQKFEDSMDLLLLINDYKLHYVYTKDFDTFMFHKTKQKQKKNGFVRLVYSVLVVKMC